MNKRICIAVLCLIFTRGVYSQGMVFFEGPWAKVLEKAKAENKNIFVDAYTDWCGPCKMMVKNVFPLPEVGAFYNRNFINYKLNMEKGDGVDFARTFQVGVYPSYLFFNAEGRMLHRTVGYKQGPQFIADGAAALDTTRQLVTNILKYQTGNREPQILYNLALGLAEAGAPDANLEKEYLKTQEGNALIRKENYDFILRAQSGYRGEAFKVLLANREKFYTVAPAESINDFISSTLFRTLQYAVGNHMNLLADSVMTDLRQFQEPLRSQFLAYAEILKNANNSGREKYFSAVIQYIETYGSRDMEKKSAYAMELANTRQPDKLDKAITWMNSVLEQDKSLKNYEMMAYIYLAAGKKSEAQSISEQGIKVAESIDGDDSALREYLRQATQ
jgi:thiol-disulfide isomerase/thioredoxin